MSSGTESRAAVAQDPLNVTPSYRGGNRGGGRGRGSGRGGRGGGRNNESQAPGGENNSSGRSRGQRSGRGGQDKRQRPDGATNGDAVPASGQRRSWGVGEQTPKELGGASKPDAEDAAASDLDSESSICFICAYPVKYSSIAPCNHVTCHICAIRMRALYKNKTCAHCRTESEWVVFSKDESKRFEEFQESELVARNDALGVKFEDQSIYDDTTLLLRYNCPDVNCDRACRGWPDLHFHVRSAHNRVLCDLCSRNKKVFTHEHTLFTPQELRKHERTGDDQPGSENQSGFKGHPECGFCRERFFSSDELYVHCRDKHEKCFLCDRRNPGAQQDYYVNYEALVAHFREDHFMCGEPDCLEKKFVVFDSEMDLKAHQLEVHPNSLSKGALRDARRVELRSLEDRRPQNQHGGRRGAGRMRLESEEQIPRTEQQMSRAELAYHRTLAVQSAQSTTSRMFGGQLTDPTPVIGPTPQNAPGAAQPFANGPTPPPRPTVQAAIRPAQTLNTNGTATPPRPPPRPADASAIEVAFPPLAAPRTAQAELLHADGPVPEESRRVKHASVLERAGSMLRNNETKLTTFKSHVSNYQQGKVTAAGLVDLFWSLFDVHAPELGKLIKELADLFDDEQKKQGLLKAWNSWKAINEDYPPFAGASSSSSNTSTSTSRLLKLKSSTSPSARSTTARQGAWGAAAAPLPSQSSRISKNRPVPGAVPWVPPKPSTTPSSSPSPSFPTVVVAPPPPIRRAVASTVDFPSLPTKPPPPPGWGPIKRKDHGAPRPSGNPWGGQGEGSADPSDAEANPNQDGGAGKKKKGKQKQLLFHVGL